MFGSLCFNYTCAECNQVVSSHNDLKGALCSVCILDIQAKRNAAEKRVKTANFINIVELLKDKENSDLLLAWLLVNSIPINCGTKIETLDQILAHLETSTPINK